MEQMIKNKDEELAMKDSEIKEKYKMIKELTEKLNRVHIEKAIEPVAGPSKPSDEISPDT